MKEESDSLSSNQNTFENLLKNLNAYQFLDAFRQHLSDAYCITDPEGFIIDANDLYCNTFAYSQEEILNKNFTELLPQRMRPYALMLHHEYVNGESDENAAEWAYEDKNGSKIHVRSTTSRLNLSSNHAYKLEVLQILPQSSTERKDRLAKSLHQFKNTLQEITGLLQLQAVQLKGQDKKEIVEAQRRITAIAIAFELLHKSTKAESVEINEYVSRLLPQLLSAHQLHLSPHKLYWQVNKVYALGIIITECVNNWLRETADGTDLKILSKNTNDSYIISIQLSQSFAGEISGFSNQLIMALGRQLQAKVGLLKNDSEMIELVIPS